MIGNECFSVEQSGDVTVVRIVDTRSFDTASYAQLQQNLVEFVAGQQPRKLLVDLGNVYICSTALIAGLIMAQKRIESRAGVMKLFGLSEVTLETLQRLKLAGTVLQVCTDEAEARKALQVTASRLSSDSGKIFRLWHISRPGREISSAHAFSLNSLYGHCSAYARD